jgi:Zn-dependent M16 (insulinase) family peptidase
LNCRPTLTHTLKAMVSFTNQALKGVMKTYQIDLLEKYQAVSKEDVLQAFRKHLLPLFDPGSSVAVVVTAPSKVDQAFDGLSKAGFVVEQRTLDFDPDELDSDGQESDEGTESEDEARP